MKGKYMQISERAVVPLFQEPEKPGQPRFPGIISGKHIAIANKKSVFMGKRRFFCGSIYSVIQWFVFFNDAFQPGKQGFRRFFSVQKTEDIVKT